MKNELTLFQEGFCQAYARMDGTNISSASDAYRESGYSFKNKSAKSIHEAASKLLANAKVMTRIKELQSISAEIAKKKFEIDSTEILRQLKIYSSSSIDEYVEFKEIDVPVVTVTGRGKKKVETVTMVKRTVLQFKTFDQLTKEQLSCIESIKEGKYGIELKLHGKQWTIDMINKHIGLYEKDNRQKVPEPDEVVFDLANAPEELLQEIQKYYKKQNDE